jgi:hypothetical protein
MESHSVPDLGVTTPPVASNDIDSIDFFMCYLPYKTFPPADTDFCQNYPRIDLLKQSAFSGRDKAFA